MIPSSKCESMFLRESIHRNVAVSSTVIAITLGSANHFRSDLEGLKTKYKVLHQRLPIVMV